MVRPSRWTDELADEAIRLRRDEGLSCREIGERLDMSKSQIIGKLQRLGVLTKPVNREKKRPAKVFEAVSRSPKSQAAAPVRRTQPETTIPQIPIVTKPLALLTIDDCRFPLWGHDTPPDDRYCGAPVLVRLVNGEGVRSSYCAGHFRLCIAAVRA